MTDTITEQSTPVNFKLRYSMITEITVIRSHCKLKITATLALYAKKLLFRIQFDDKVFSDFVI